MKRVSFLDVLEVSKKLNGKYFVIHVTCPKKPLQTKHTTNFIVDMITMSYIPKLRRLQNIIARHNTITKQAFIYVSDENYVKYF